MTPAQAFALFYLCPGLIVVLYMIIDERTSLPIDLEEWLIYFCVAIFCVIMWPVVLISLMVER